MSTKKMILPIVVAVVILALLVAGILLISRDPQAAQATPTPEPTQVSGDAASDTQVEAENPFIFARDDVVDVTITNPKGNLHITRTTPQDRFVVEGQEDVVVSTNKVLDPVYIFTNMTLQDEISGQDVSDLASFGLAEPVISATFVTKDGDSRTLNLGNELYDKSGYYMQIQGDERIFAVWASMYSTLNVNIGALRDTVMFEINPASVTAVRIDTAQQQLNILKETNRFSEWIVQGPHYQRLADGAKVTALLAQLGQIKPEELVAELVGDEKPADYGLDKPTGTITITQDGKDLVLTLGKEEGISYWYCAGNAMDAVYKLSKSMVDFTKFTPFNLSYSHIYLPEKSKVTAVIMSWEGKEKTLKAGTDEFDAFFGQFLGVKLFAEVGADETAGKKLGSITFVGHMDMDDQTSPLAAQAVLATSTSVAETHLEFFEMTDLKCAYSVNGAPAYFEVRVENMQNLAKTVFGDAE